MCHTHYKCWTDRSENTIYIHHKICTHRNDYSDSSWIQTIVVECRQTIKKKVNENLSNKYYVELIMESETTYGHGFQQAFRGVSIRDWTL